MHLASVRLGVYDIHEDDMTAALAAAREAGVDVAVSLFSGLNDALGGSHRVILNVMLCRVGRDRDGLVGELLMLTDLAVSHGHRVLFVQVRDLEDVAGGSC